MGRNRGLGIYQQEEALMNNGKKRQHYIQKASLKPWTDINKQLCVYLKEENRIIHSSPASVGVEKNFYSLPDLNQDELTATLGLTRLVHLPDKYIMNLQKFSDNKKQASTLKEKRIWQSVQDVFIEELYGSIESAFPRNLILNNDLSFWKSNKKISNACLSFLFYQLFRTKRTQDTIVELQSKNEDLLNKNIDWKKVYRYYNFVLPIVAINNLKAWIEEYNLEIVTTIPKCPLLIGDQPVINLAFIPKKSGQPKSNMFLYYPISPNQALCFYHRDSIIRYHGELSENEVDQLNRKQFEMSLQQIYSNNEEILKKYIENL